MTGPSDFGDRIVQALIWFAIVFCLANGTFMLFDPMGWYYFLPTLRATGPANTHFIADIGIAYLGCGIILLYAVRNIRMRWLAALAGGRSDEMKSRASFAWAVGSENSEFAQDSLRRSSEIGPS